MIKYTKKWRENLSKAMKGNKNRWKGGRRKTTASYIQLYLPKHPHSDKKGRIFEHRVIMEKYLRRYLKPTEFVHHLNGIKDDNRIENLALVMNVSHRKQKIKIGCPYCSKEFLINH